MPKLLRDVGTRLIIINNAHQLRWRQWQQLITIDDYLANIGHRVAIVFSSVLHDIDKVPGLPTQAEVVEQIEERIKCRKQFHGYSDAELQHALKALLQPHDAKLAESVAHQYELVRDHLLRPTTNPLLRGSVGTGRVVDLVRWIVAAREKHRDLSTEALVKKAYALYAKELLDDGQQAKALAGQVAGLRNKIAA